MRRERDPRRGERVRESGERVRKYILFQKSFMRPESNPMESCVGRGMFDGKWNVGGMFNGKRNAGVMLNGRWNVRWNGMLLECSVTFAERLKEYSVQAVVEPYAR